MEKCYTRACNFYYGKISRLKVKKKQSLRLHGNKNISFDHIEVISRKSSQIIHYKNLKQLKKDTVKRIRKDLNKITKKKNFKKLNLLNIPILMGILNLTPDSFSDGGKFNKNNKGFLHSKKLIKDGCDILDIGGESTRPKSLNISKEKEWKRIRPTLSKLFKKNFFLSIDTRKSFIMEKAIEQGVDLVNDISGLTYDLKTINLLKKYKTPFVIHHILGTPQTMQINPNYKNVLLDIYDYFEKKISFVRKKGINHENILLDPGIGFGKNLKHNITLLSNISIFHSLGFPILLGVSRKRFIKDISGLNDSRQRIGGTVAAVLSAMLQGVQVFRVHDVNEIKQSVKVFKSIIND